MLSVAAYAEASAGQLIVLSAAALAKADRSMLAALGTQTFGVAVCSLAVGAAGEHDSHTRQSDRYAATLATTLF
jgi:hypothetical protein